MPCTRTRFYAEDLIPLTAEKMSTINILKGNSRENYPCFLSSLWFPNGM